MKTGIILGLIVLVLIIGFVILKPEKGTPEKEIEGGKISLEEKQLIEIWITKNNLNQYGDPKDTVYIGGTPLFDESTGKSIDKHEYIIKNYPDRPWLKK